MAAPDALYDTDTGEFIGLATDAQFVFALERENRTVWLAEDGAMFDESGTGRRHVQMQHRRTGVVYVPSEGDHPDDGWREAWANAYKPITGSKTARRKSFEAVFYPGIWVVVIAVVVVLLYLSQGGGSGGGHEDQRDYPDTCYGRQGAFDC